MGGYGYGDDGAGRNSTYSTPLRLYNDATSFVTLFVYLVNKRIVLQIERVYVMVGTGLKKAGRQGEIR